MILAQGFPKGRGRVPAPCLIESNYGLMLIEVSTRTQHKHAAQTQVHTHTAQTQVHTHACASLSSHTDEQPQAYTRTNINTLGIVRVGV